jgi:Homeodomain-like domain
MARHSDDIVKAAELHRQGVPQKDIAAKVGVTTRQLQRWARDARYVHLFERHEPGSTDHRRAILLQALDQGSLSEQLRAVELLGKLGENDKRGSGAQRVAVHLHGPRVCPECGAHLETESSVVQRSDCHNGDSDRLPVAPGSGR